MYWVIVVLFMGVLALALVLSYGGAGRAGPTNDARPPLGILGDSDSQAYQENWKSRGVPAYGGNYHGSTYQWPEILARLRGSEVDLGAWGRWGVRRRLSLAWFRDAVGLRWRAPRKSDYRYNLAWPTGCASLLRGPGRQVPRLVEIMDEDPQRWRRGVVLIRIGVNDFGKEPLDGMALNGDDPAAHQIMRNCVRYISQAVEYIRGRHPETAIVLVGIFDNTHWPKLFHKFRTPAAAREVARGLDYFDNSLRGLCASHPRMAFFDDRKFLRQRWGSRDEQGIPAYRSVTVGKLEVTNTAGDHPRNLVLEDGHAGVAWNLLWVQALIDLLRSEFGMNIAPLSPLEIETFVDGLNIH